MSYNLVWCCTLQQCIILLPFHRLDIVKKCLNLLFQNEQLEHSKTKTLLAKESEKLEFALGEINILNKQLKREKDTFEEM